MFTHPPVASFLCRCPQTVQCQGSAWGEKQDVWRSVATFGDLRQLFTIYGDIWQFMAILGTFVTLFYVI